MNTNCIGIVGLAAVHTQISELVIRSQRANSVRHGARQLVSVQMHFLQVAVLRKYVRDAAHKLIVVEGQHFQMAQSAKLGREPARKLVIMKV